MKHNIILIASFALLLSACKKKVDTEPSGTTPLGNAKAILVNRINDSIIINFTGHDIATGTQPHIFSTTVAALDTIELKNTDLKDKYRYSYSWHSADYTFSNWFAFTENMPAIGEFDYYADSADKQIELNGKKRNDLLICLDGNGISSTWKATNAYDNTGASVWSALPDTIKDHTFIINRYYNSKHTYRDSTNKQVANLLRFTLYDTSSAFMLRVSGTENYILTNNLNPIATLETNSLNKLYFSKYYVDTNGNLQYPAPYYLIERQSVEK
ncbi:MAG: hypothetical protein H6551_08195 [Chitinophagales bacterium]|nr:hypothetical protein [Chitinophagaceae bacterium]MCB9065103.1 hypothetical protein [Chitinophagales bacterium]